MSRNSVNRIQFIIVIGLLSLLLYFWIIKDYYPDLDPGIEDEGRGRVEDSTTPASLKIGSTDLPFYDYGMSDYGSDLEVPCEIVNKSLIVCTEKPKITIQNVKVKILTPAEVDAAETSSDPSLPPVPVRDTQ